MTTNTIKKVLVTERAVALNDQRKYVFIVEPRATKQEIKKAVHELYRVDATAVNIVRLPGKPRRFRGVQSVKPGRKKAIVTIKEGQTIDIGR